MRIGKKICNLQGRRNQRQSNGAMRWWRVRWQSISMCLVRSWKTKLWAIWIELWLSQYIGVGWEKKTLISASNQRNQTISLVEDVMAEAKQLQRQNINTKLQKLKESRNTKFCRNEIQNITPKKHYKNWTQIPNYKNWREDEIPKQLQRQNRSTKLQKLKECRNTRFCRSGRQNITPKNIAETECKYQITETEEKMKYQNNCRDKIEIPNCRSWRNVEIPDFAEAEDKISFQKTLQKLKRRWNTKTIAETKQKYQITEAEESKIKVQILILQPQAQNLIFILHLLIGQTTHVWCFEKWIWS
jgi:hypothetical protein